MICIEQSHVQEALDYFGINKKVSDIKIVTNDQEERQGKRAVRIVVVVSLQNEEKLIVKFLNERAFCLDVSHLKLTTETIEKQSDFSEFLRKEGMIVPERYQRDGRYCMSWSREGFSLDVTIEKYLGEPVEIFHPKLFYDYGCMIGRLHEISVKNRCWIGFSIVFREVQENRTDFSNIFRGLDMGIIPKNLLADISKYHDIYKQEVIEAWPLLPRSAVQGDLYSCNNIAMTAKGIGFYDFNIAADEVLLGDMLHVWFRTLYDVDNEGQVSEWNIKRCWEDYNRGYQQFRKWTEEELQVMPKVYALLRSIYVGRYAADLIRKKRHGDARHILELELAQLKNGKRKQMRIHFVKGKDSDIAYFCDTLEIRKVTPEERTQLEQQVTNEAEYPEFKVEEEEGYFSTLILHVSNTCNMRCAYCFANHGKYGSKDGIMSEQVALDAIDVFYKKYSKIKQIKFFGGEPFMNVPVMDVVCRHIQEKFERSEIVMIPEYKVVTNGTIMSDEAMEIVRKYDIQVVFSMDGPEEIHDYARVMGNGEGSFAKIRENFFRLREYTDGKQPYGVEMTYTAVHRDHGYSMKDVTDYFMKHFDLEARNVNISPVSAEDGTEYALQDYNFCMVQSAGEILDAKRNGESCELDQKLFFLVKKMKAGRKSDRQMCNAAWKWAAVSSTGDVYPCLMFMDRQEYKLGNIYESLFEDSRYKRITDEWKYFNRYERPACRHCFANNICINCMGQNMFSTGSVYEKTPEQCKAMRALAEKVIEGIAEGVF